MGSNSKVRWMSSVGLGNTLPLCHVVSGGGGVMVWCGVTILVHFDSVFLSHCVVKAEASSTPLEILESPDSSAGVGIGGVESMIGARIAYRILVRSGGTLA
jgi:hypothetical protein